MIYKALIIDDEEPARLRMRHLLAVYQDKISIAGEAANGIEAVEKIENLQPDIIFLDIQMPGLNGFEVLEKLTFSPIVIFTTAYDQYALKAFETTSVDYLLKPIDPVRFAQTIEKLEKLSNPFKIESFRRMFGSGMWEKPKEEQTTFTIRIGDKFQLLRLKNILYFEAKDKYVSIFTDEGKEHLTEQTLKTLEEKLPANFIRIHRGIIVNKLFVNEIQKYFQGKYCFKLQSKEKISLVSGSSYSEIIKQTFKL
jgi:two-component system, LytTR family, response regulator